MKAKMVVDGVVAVFIVTSAFLALWIFQVKTQSEELIELSLEGMTRLSLFLTVLSIIVVFIVLRSLSCGSPYVTSWILWALGAMALGSGALSLWLFLICLGIGAEAFLWVCALCWMAALILAVRELDSRRSSRRADG